MYNIRSYLSQSCSTVLYKNESGLRKTGKKGNRVKQGRGFILNECCDASIGMKILHSCIISNHFRSEGEISMSGATSLIFWRRKFQLIHCINVFYRDFKNLISGG